MTSTPSRRLPRVFFFSSPCFFSPSACGILHGSGCGAVVCLPCLLPPSSRGCFVAPFPTLLFVLGAICWRSDDAIPRLALPSEVFISLSTHSFFHSFLPAVSVFPAVASTASLSSLSLHTQTHALPVSELFVEKCFSFSHSVSLARVKTRQNSSSSLFPPSVQFGAALQKKTRSPACVRMVCGNF